MFRGMVIVAFSLLVLGALSGCATKAFVKPYSQVREESRKGLKGTPSVEEEKAFFFKHSKDQEARLMSLLRERAESLGRDSNYKVGRGDEIEINVFDVPELNVTTKVRESGFITLPLVGAIEAVGKTDAELNDEMKKRLSSFVKDPQVNVFISHYGSQRVAVMGAVNKPGTYPLNKGSNSLLELISEAGGATEKSGNMISFVPAEISGISGTNDIEARARMSLASYNAPNLKESGIEIPLDKVMGTYGGIPLEIPVKGGDMIIVREAGQVLVEGEVEKPGSFELGKRMTLLGALAAAGGISYAAKVDEIEVIRDSGEDRKGRLIVNLEKIASGEEPDVRLQTGDLVKVPTDSGRHLTRNTMEGISRVVNIGVGGSVNLVP